MDTNKLSVTQYFVNAIKGSRPFNAKNYIEYFQFPTSTRALDGLTKAALNLKNSSQYKSKSDRVFMTAVDNISSKENLKSIEEEFRLYANRNILMKETVEAQMQKAIHIEKAKQSVFSIPDVVIPNYLLPSNNSNASSKRPLVQGESELTRKKTKSAPTRKPAAPTRPVAPASLVAPTRELIAPTRPVTPSTDRIFIPKPITVDPPAKSNGKNFLKKGQGPVVINENAVQWNPNGTRVSEGFHVFRNKCIIKAANHRPSETEQLGLNGIIEMEKESNDYYGFEEEEWVEAIDEMRREYEHLIAPNLKERQLDNVAKTSRKSFNDGMGIAETWMAECITKKSENLTIAKTTVTMMVNYDSIDVNTAKESLYQSKCVEPLVSPFMRLNNTIYKGNSDESEGSRLRRKSEGRVPDISLNSTIQNYNQTIFLSEIKSVKYMNQFGGNPDYIKLCNLMKDELDRSVNQNEIDDEKVVVTGLLVQGLRARLFAMDLKYTGMYRLLLLEEFTLPSSTKNFCCLSDCLQSCATLMNVLKDTHKRCLAHFRDRLRDFPSRKTPTLRKNLPIVSYSTPSKDDE